MSESVYVLKNPSYLQDVLKIGGTAGSITKRANDLSRPTGVPTPFIPIMKIKTDNWRELEKSIHSYLHELRTPNKEFFKISEEELYTKLTEEMKLTVEKITDTDDGEDSEGGDSEGGDSQNDSWCDGKSKNKGNGCTICGGKCGMLAPVSEKQYKLLQKITSDFLELYKNMASRGSNKYYTVKHSPMVKDHYRKKYREFICEHKNNRCIPGEGFKYCKVPSLANNLYDYNFNDNWFDDKELYNELKVFRQDFNIFIAQKISELEDGIYSGDLELKRDDSYTKTDMFKGDTKSISAELKKLSKKLDEMSEQIRKWS
jgi:hypothetical protein